LPAEQSTASSLHETTDIHQIDEIISLFCQNPKLTFNLKHYSFFQPSRRSLSGFFLRWGFGAEHELIGIDILQGHCSWFSYMYRISNYLSADLKFPHDAS
jgi:hypothetical protein